MRATISACGQYRYLLERTIVKDPEIEVPVIFTMLNPSDADAKRNDPTVLRCIHFASIVGGTKLIILNHFAFRSPHPSRLLEVDDPVGPENEIFLEKHLSNNRCLKIAAWGGNVLARAPGLALAKKYGPFHCLGTNWDGSPKHPLARGRHRIPNAFRPILWKPNSEMGN